MVYILGSMGGLQGSGVVHGELAYFLRRLLHRLRSKLSYPSSSDNDEPMDTDSSDLWELGDRF